MTPQAEVRYQDFIAPRDDLTKFGLRVTAEAGAIGRVEVAAIRPAVDLPFQPPPAAITAPDGRAEDGLLWCGLTFRLADGASAGDSCAPYWLPLPSDRALFVGPGSQLSLAIEDWTIDSVSVEAALQSDIATAESDVTWLPLAEVAGPASRVSFTAPTEPGAWLLSISVKGLRGGDRFGAPYLVRVDVGPTWLSVTGPADWSPDPGYYLEAAGNVWITNADHPDGVTTIDLPEEIELLVRRRDNCAVIARLVAYPGHSYLVRFADDGTARVEDRSGLGVDTGPSLGDPVAPVCDPA